MKDKEKIKRFQSDVEGVKKQQIEDEKENEQEAIAHQTFDQKQSVVDFLSTVISVAENLGINFEKIFHDKSGQNHKPTPKVLDGPVEIPIEPETQVEKADYMHVKLYKD